MIDLTPIGPTSSASSSTPQAQTATANQIAALLGVPVGQRVAAVVAEVSALTATEKAFLSEKLNAGIAAKTSTTPEAPPSSAPPHKTSMFVPLKPDNTLLVKVIINQKSAHLLSDLPLKTGSLISVRIRPEGQLQLLSVAATGKPAPDTMKPSAVLASSTSNSAQPTSSLAQVTLSPKEAPKPGSSLSKTAYGHNAPNHRLAVPQTNSSTEVLSKTTTSTLPANLTATPPAQKHQSTPSLLLTNTEQNSEQSNKSSKAVRAYAHSSPAHTQLNLSPLQRKQLDQIQEAIRQVLPSANKAHALLQATAHIPARLPGIDSPGPTTTVAESLRALSQLKMQPLDIQQLLKAPIPAVKQAIERSGIFYEQRIANPPPKTEVTRAVESDFKYLLLNTLSTLQNASNALNQPINNADKSVLEQLLQLFNKPTTGNAKANQHANTNSQNSINQLVQRIQNTIANIQVQQYKTASSVITDQAQNTQSFYMDVPIRLYQGFGNIFMQWQEQKVQEKEEDKKSKKEKKQQTKWRVYMELELGEEGNLAIDLNVIEQQVNAQMWTDEPELRSKAKAQLDTLKNDLETQGFTVTDIRCHAGKSQQKQNSIHCSVVDVKT